MRWLIGSALVLTAAMALGSVQVGPAPAAPAPAAPAPNNPIASLVRDMRDAAPIEGRVEQRLAAGSYTYLALRTERDAELWAVTLGRGVAPGSRVRVHSLGHRNEFHSRRLQRTFPELVFGIVTRID